MATLSVRQQQVVLPCPHTPSQVAQYRIIMKQAFVTNGWRRLVKPSRSAAAAVIASVLDVDGDDDLHSVGGIDVAPLRARAVADPVAERARLAELRAKAVLASVDYDSDDDHTVIGESDADIAAAAAKVKNDVINQACFQFLLASVQSYLVSFQLIRQGDCMSLWALIQEKFIRISPIQKRGLEKEWADLSQS